MPRNSFAGTYKKGASDMHSEHSKECSDCRSIKPLEEFHVYRSEPQARAYSCKECVRRRHQYQRNGVGPDPRKRRVIPPGFKWCPSCESLLELSDFGRNTFQGDGLTGYCRPCHNRIGRENRIKIEGSFRSYHLKRRYGLTEAEVVEMIEARGGTCAVCWEGKPKQFDHDHQTGKVRGILCFTCNGGLGQFKDDVNRLINAIAYLEERSWMTEPAGLLDSRPNT